MSIHDLYRLCFSVGHSLILSRYCIYTIFLLTSFVHAQVSMMPEYLMVCCWRSIKEVSLLLGELMQNTAVYMHPDIRKPDIKQPDISQTDDERLNNSLVHTQQDTESKNSQRSSVDDTAGHRGKEDTALLSVEQVNVNTFELTCTS